MNTKIKTYEQVNREDVSSTFSVSKMEASYAKRVGKKEAPHRHEFYTVILISKAKGQHFIDFNEYLLEGNQVFFVSPGQVHQVLEEEKSFGYVLTFSTQFLVNNNIPISFIGDLNLFNDYGNSSPLKLNQDQLEKLTQFCKEIAHFHNSDLKFKEQAIGASLKLFLIHCNNLETEVEENPQILQAGHTILKNFKDAVELHHTEWHSSQQYADHLHITPDHLNRTIKSLIGKTVKDCIQTRIAIAAKRLLYFSDLSTKEIGYELGFSEASNFSAFFKKYTQVSPSEFKKNR